MTLRLRPVQAGDLPVFFAHQSDAEAAAMAAFVPRARPAFDAHWRTIMARPDCIVRTVEVDAAVAGYVSVFSQDGQTEIAYWFGREHWGRGVGSAAVAAFLRDYRARPVFGSVESGNIASRAILERCGFTFVSEDIGPDGVREHRFRLE